MSSLRWPINAVVLCAASWSGYAGAAIPDTLVVSMEEALSTALAHNVTVLTAEEAVAVQRASRNEARSAFLPTVSASGSYSDTWGEEDAGLPDGGDATLGASITGSWTIWNGGGRWADLSRQSAALRRAEASLWQAKQGVLQSTIDAYLTLVETLHAFDVAEQSLRLAMASSEQSTGLLNAGKATVSDVLRTDVNVAQQRTAVVRARNAVTTARRALSDLLGGPFVLIVPVEPEFEPIQLLDTPLPAGAAESTPLVAIAEAAVAQAHATTLGQKSRFLPRLSASATSSWSEQDGELGEPDRRGSLGLSWSLFEGGARCFALQGAKASERGARWDLQDARRQSQSSLEQAWSDMRAAEAQWEAAKQTVALAEDSYAQETELYNLGRATSLEVLTALDTLNESRREEIASRYEILRAYAQLRAVLGTLDATMFKGSHLRPEAM
jgi:outer membrane protein TolC